MYQSEQNRLRYLNSLDGRKSTEAVIVIARIGERSKMALMEHCGEMWARNAENIQGVPAKTKGGQGIYVLYDGSTPVYVGKGNIQSRLRRANNRSKRRGNSWDHFSWYILKENGLIHDVEVLLLRILPPYLRYMTRIAGKFRGVRLKGKKRRRVYLKGEVQKNSKLTYNKRLWLR
jgi:hypothetical protein